jgi:tetratricopeptide (TPR) repeat protein
MNKILVVGILLISFSTGYSEVGENWYHYEQGMRMLNAGNYDQSQKEFDYYLKHPEMHRNYFGIAHFGRGLMFQKMGKFDLAISEYRMAIENDQHPLMKVSESAYTNLGALYMQLKSYPEAVRVYSDFVRKSPKNGFAHYYLGLSYLREGDYENAEREAEIAKKLGVEFTALQEDLAKIKESPKNDAEDMKQRGDRKNGKKVKKKKAE